MVMVTMKSVVRSTLRCGMPGRTMEFQPCSSDCKLVKPRSSCAEAPSPVSSCWPTPCVHESPVSVMMIWYEVTERIEVSFAAVKKLPESRMVPVLALIWSAEDDSPMPAKVSCRDASAPGGRLTEIVSARRRLYEGKLGRVRVMEEPST